MVNIKTSIFFQAKPSNDRTRLTQLVVEVIASNTRAMVTETLNLQEFEYGKNSKLKHATVVGKTILLSHIS